jgi:hypothetical protein
MAGDERSLKSAAPNFRDCWWQNFRVRQRPAGGVDGGEQPKRRIGQPDSDRFGKFEARGPTDGSLTKKTSRPVRRRQRAVDQF